MFDLLKNSYLRFKEKSGNGYHRQVMRMVKMLSRYPKVSIRNRILKVVLGITYSCQCNCSYCCAGLHNKDPERELREKDFKDVIDQINDFPSLFTTVVFFGGEPLLRKEIFKLVKHSCERGLFTELETNGILLTSENVKRLKQAGLNHIVVRIEDVNPECHDRLSGFDGCFEKALQGIKYCVEKRLPCSITTVAFREKLQNGGLQKIVDLGKELNVSSVRILYPMAAGRWLENKKEILTSEEKKKIRAFLDPGFVYLESTYTCTPKSERICPVLQKKFFYISCYGEIQPCPFVPLVFGNIRERSLNEIVEKMWGAPFLLEQLDDCMMNDINFRKKYKKALEK